MEVALQGGRYGMTKESLRQLRIEIRLCHCTVADFYNSFDIDEYIWLE